MYSYRSFRPGNNGNSSRIIKYVAEYNLLYGVEGKIKTCYCVSNKYDKNTPGSDSPSEKLSYATKLSQMVRLGKSGKIQYGNFYLGQPLNINYLGRMEGMSGGSGSPPINKF